MFPPTYAVATTAENKYAIEERQVGDRVATTVAARLGCFTGQPGRTCAPGGLGGQGSGVPCPVRGTSPGSPTWRTLAESRCWRLLTASPMPSSGTACSAGRSSDSATSARRSPRRVPATPRTCSATRQRPCCSASGTRQGPRAVSARSSRGPTSRRSSDWIARIGRQVGSRIDPLQIERDAAVVYEHADPQQRWTLDTAEAALEKSKPKPAGGDGRPIRDQPRQHRTVDRRSGGWL